MNVFATSALTAVAKTGLTAAAAAGIWATCVEPHLFTLRHLRVPVLPAASSHMRVLHVSDLHAAPWQRDKITWVRNLAALQPDLVINTGDNFGFNSLTTVLDALEPLTRFPGLFVFGSNDFHGPKLKNPARYLAGPSEADDSAPNLPAASLQRALINRGWHYLDNRTATLNVRGLTISACGLGDTHMGAATVTDTHPRFDHADVKLGVTHSPYSSALDALIGAGAHMVYAGHTHGGQIRVPLYGAPVTNCDRPRNEARGLFTRAGVPVHVSAGLGYSIFAPVRFACRPEATLVELVPRKN